MCNWHLQLTSFNVYVFNFFVVLGNGQALLGMPDIKTLGILNCNTVDTQKADRCDKFNTNIANYRVHDVHISTQT